MRIIYIYTTKARIEHIIIVHEVTIKFSYFTANTCECISITSLSSNKNLIKIPILPPNSSNPLNNAVAEARVFFAETSYTTTTILLRTKPILIPATEANAILYQKSPFS